MASRLPTLVYHAWVIEEVEETYTGDTAEDDECVMKKCLQPIQLGNLKGKWPGDFIAAFQERSSVLELLEPSLPALHLFHLHGSSLLLDSPLRTKVRSRYLN